MKYNSGPRVLTNQHVVRTSLSEGNRNEKNTHIENNISARTRHKDDLRFILNA